MLRVLTRGSAVAAMTLLLAAGCSDSGSGSTSAGAGASSSSAPPSTAVATSTVSPAPTVPPTTVPAGPVVAEAGGWRLAVTAPVLAGTVGPATDICYDAAGPAGPSTITLEVALVISVTGSVVSTAARVDAALGHGAARVNLGTVDNRRYDLTVQGIADGRPVAGLLATVRGVQFATAAPPSGCP